jgi:hypothetical protein
MTMEAMTWSTIPARRQCASHLANDAGHCVVVETALGEVAEKMEGGLDARRRTQESRAEACGHARMCNHVEDIDACTSRWNGAQEGLATSWSSTTSSTCTWRSTSSLAADGSSWALVGHMHQRSDARKSREAVHWWPRPGSSAGRATAMGSSMKVRHERFGLIASRSWICS